MMSCLFLYVMVVFYSVARERTSVKHCVMELPDLHKGGHYISSRANSQHVVTSLVEVRPGRPALCNRSAEVLCLWWEQHPMAWPEKKQHLRKTENINNLKLIQATQMIR